MKYDSWHVCIYRLVYTTKLPDNLYIYLWKFFWGLIFSIPNIILQLPTIIGNLIEGDSIKEVMFSLGLYADNANDRRTMGLISWILIGVFCFYSWSTYSLILWVNYVSVHGMKNLDGFEIPGAFLNIIILILLIFRLKSWIVKQKWFDNKINWK